MAIKDDTFDFKDVNLFHKLNDINLLKDLFKNFTGSHRSSQISYGGAI